MAEDAHVSTGRLPAPERVQTWVEDAHDRFATDASGAVSRVYPALTEVPADLFGICVVSSGGRTYAPGDADRELTIMSVSKPFVFALAWEGLGPAGVRDRVGVNGTGLPFNSLAAVESSPDGRTNPMVNAGAIATASLLGWEEIRDGLNRFAGRALAFDDAVYASASATNHRNQALARLLQDRGRIYA